MREYTKIFYPKKFSEYDLKFQSDLVNDLGLDERAEM